MYWIKRSAKFHKLDLDSVNISSRDTIKIFPNGISDDFSLANKKDRSGSMDNSLRKKKLRNFRKKTIANLQ